MVTILLEKILTLLTGWLDAFTEHSTNVLSKLNLIEEDTSNLSDIKDNTADTASNTASVITPINNISSNTSSIKTNTDSIKADTTIIKNNINTISTNTGSASAYCQNIANNTLDCSNRLVTIGSDTTQLRSNSNNITADVADIKTALNYYIGNTLVTEDSEGVICNIDTDLEDYLQKSIVTIPADNTGFSGITINKTKKNINPYDIYNLTPTYIWGTNFLSLVSLLNTLPAGTYTLSNKYKVVTLPGNNKVQYGKPYIRALVNGSYINLNIYSTITDNNPTIGKVYETNTTFTIPAEAVGNISNVYLYCDQDTTHSGSDRGTYSGYDFQLEIGENFTPFENYTVITHSVSLGSTITDGAEIDLLSGIVKINSTPVTYTSITPIAIRTYNGINNIRSDIGNMSVTYRETLKHYLDKQ